MRRIAIPLLALVLFAACESNENFWTAEACNQRLEMDIVDFEKYQTKFAKVKSQMEIDARSGNTVSAEANKKNAESWKESTRSLLKFIDSNVKPVCEGKFRQDLLLKVEEARKFASGTEEIKDPGAEDMPDLRVTSITSTFTPYELDQYGKCAGPYLNLAFTVTNMGGNYPRPVDLETYVGRAERPPEGLQFFTVIGELDFGEEMKKRLDLTVTGGSGGSIPKGGTLAIPAKLLVGYNQTHAKVTGRVETTFFLRTTESSAAYETEITVPLWDIYTVSHLAIDGKDRDNGKYYIAGKGTVTNQGASPTPGPIGVSFMIYDDTVEKGRYITGWSGKTDGPVTGPTDIYSKEFSTLKLPAKIRVESSIIPLCPDGQAGNLADGDTKNNVRELRQAMDSGASASPASSAGG